MKIMSLLFAVLLISISTRVNAQVISTLQHNGNTAVFYNQSGLIDAYNNAVDGDTIYLSAGHFNPVTINKRISVFGAGHFPDSTLATGVTYIDGGFEIQDNADSSFIEGIYIGGTITFQSGMPVSYIHMRRNYIYGGINFAGSRLTPCMYTLIEGNVIMGWVEMSNALQCDIANNFIHYGVQYALNCSVRNNVFFSGYGYGWPHYSQYSIYDCDNSLIENNVFVSSNMVFYCDNILFRNNVLSGAIYSPNTTATYASNYENVTMTTLFVNYTGGAFSYTNNFHLQSPATLPGSDGSQIGVFGNSFPFKEGAVPVNPHVRSITIPANTDASGNLNINVNAAAQQN